MEKDTDFYTLSATTLTGENVQMDTFKGKVVLIVNTASKCGFSGQYKGLETLHQKYYERGLVVLGFPCNQFLNQEPGDEATIAQTCEVNFGVTFPVFRKIDVNGPDTHPIYQFLKSKKTNLLSRRVKWNFEKFIVDRNGNVVERYSSLKKPEALEIIIEKYL